MKAFRFLKTFHKPATALHSLKENLAVLFLDLGTSLDQRGLVFQQNLIAQEMLSRHITAESLYGNLPSISETAKIANMAHLKGYVRVHENARIDAFAVLVANTNAIEIGEGSYIGKYTTLSVRDDLEDNVPMSVNIGKNSMIGDKCLLTNVVVGDNVWVGDGCVIMEGTVIEDNVIVLANTVILSNRWLQANRVYGKVGEQEFEELREVSEQDKAKFEKTIGGLRKDVGSLDKDQNHQMFLFTP